MATYKGMQIAKKRGKGTFKVIDIHVDCYNNSGKFKGANKQTFNNIKTEACQRFAQHFTQFREGLLVDGWDFRVSFIFGDD